MWFRTLSELIGQSFEDEIRKGSPPPALARTLSRAMHDPAVSLCEQDALLASVLRVYRATGEPGWSAAVLEMLAPMLAEAERLFVFVPPSVSQEDLRQQLIVECLHAARFMAIPTRDVQGRLRRRTLSRTAGWLRRGIRSEAESLERVEREAGAFRDSDQLFLMELRASGVSPDNLALLYRSCVLGMSAREIAVELCISEEAVWMRQRRALRRLRRWAPAQFRRFAGALPAVA